MTDLSLIRPKMNEFIDITNQTDSILEADKLQSEVKDPRLDFLSSL
jgi:hypothetical protein